MKMIFRCKFSGARLGRLTKMRGRQGAWVGVSGLEEMIEAPCLPRRLDESGCGGTAML